MITQFCSLIHHVHLQPMSQTLISLATLSRTQHTIKCDAATTNRDFRVSTPKKGAPEKKKKNETPSAL